MILPKASCGLKQWLELRINTKCVCFACQEAWELLCRSSARAGQGKSRFLHPLRGRERQSGQSRELPEWCSQASGSLELQCKQAASADRAAPFHKEHKSLGKWLIPGWELLSLTWPQRGAGPRGVLVELWAQECFPSCAAAWLSAPSPAWTRPTSSLPFPGWEGGTRRIHQHPQCAGHEP